jgi:hypothetical protein
MAEGLVLGDSQQEGVSRSHFTGLIRLSYLAPDITQSILDGRQPRDLTAEKLLDHSRLPLAWHDHGPCSALPKRDPDSKIHCVIRARKARLRWDQRGILADHIRCHCGTGIWPDRDNAAGWRDIETPCASLLTRSPTSRAHPRRPGFSSFESGRGRETDSPLEETGFDLSVPVARDRLDPERFVAA